MQSDHDLTISLELNADGHDSYGGLLADLTDTYDLTALSVVFLTPASASDPLVTLTFRTADSAAAFATQLGYPTFAHLLDDLELIANGPA